MSGTRRRGPYAGTAAMRAGIVAAAIEVFGAEGYRSGSLRRIGELAGISTAGLLHHFPDKTSLLLAALRAADPWTAAAEQRPADLEELVALCGATAGDLRAVALFAALTAEATVPEHPAHAQLVRGRELRLDWLARQLERLADGREALTPRILAETLLALLDGVQLRALTTGAPAAPRQLELIVGTVLRAGLGRAS